MSIKKIAFLAIGCVGVYYAANFPIVNEENLKMTKNFFTSSYTLNTEGITMTFDKRYETEMSATSDLVSSLVKLSKVESQEMETKTKSLKP